MIYNIFSFHGFMSYPVEREYIYRLQQSDSAEETNHILHEMRESSDKQTDVIMREIILTKLLEPIVFKLKRDLRHL